MTNNLPDNWDTAKLGAVCKTTSGGTPSRKRDDYFQGDIPWVKSGELPDGPISEIEEYITEEAVKNSSAKLFPSGSLLIALYGATVGKLGILNRDATTNQAVCAVFPNDGLDTKYLFWYLRHVRSDLIAQAIGGAQPNISQGILRELEIPIAPLEQQKRIVAEIEKQFSRLDEAVANLKRVKANLKRYKASVLKAAVEGKLTEEWRKQHLPAPTSRPGKFYTYAILCDDDSIYIGHTSDIERRWQEHLEGKGSELTKEHKPVKIAHYEEFDSREEAAKREKNLKTGYGRKWIKRELAVGRTRQAGRIEPASKLLERVTEKRNEWIKVESAKGNNEAKRLSSKLKKHKFNVPENIELPENWRWASFVTASQLVVDCHNKTAPYEDSGISLVRTTNVRDGKLDLDTVKYVSQETYEYWSRRCPPEPGDILFTREAPMGEAAIIPEGTTLCMGQRMMLIRLFPELINNKYFLYAILEPRFQSVFSLGAVGMGVKHLRVGDVESLVIPIPPIHEQKQIVEEVESRLSVTDEIIKETENNLHRAERLRQSILSKAFSGGFRDTGSNTLKVVQELS